MDEIDNLICLNKIDYFLTVWICENKMKELKSVYQMIWND